MSFFRSDDPGMDFDRWEAHQERQLARLPKCGICGEPIQDDHFYLINGDNVCPDCLENEFRKDVDFE